MKKVVFILLYVSLAVSCTNNWPTKEETKKVSGRWELTSINAVDTETSKDTTWTAKGGFIDFEYTKKGGPASVSYMLATDDLIKAKFTVLENGALLFMPEPGIKSSIGKKVAFPLNEEVPFEFRSDFELIVKGEVVIRDSDSVSTTGRIMRVYALFTR